MIDAVLDALGERHCLLLSRHGEDNLASIHNSGDPDRERHSRDGSEVISEETSVRKDRIVCECLDASARDEGRARLPKGHKSAEPNRRNNASTHLVEG